MKTLIITLTVLLANCSMLEKEETPVEILPIRKCVQQTEPKNPEIKCKVGDWQQIGDPKCSSTEAICLKKRF